MKYWMKYLSMSNEIIDKIATVENERLSEILTNEQWNIRWNKHHGERNIEWNTYQWVMKWGLVSPPHVLISTELQRLSADQRWSELCIHLLQPFWLESNLAMAHSASLSADQHWSECSVLISPLNAGSLNADQNWVALNRTGFYMLLLY